MIAVHFREERIVKKILDAGASVNVTDNDGKTALMWACINNYPFSENLVSEYPIIIALLESGANVDDTDNNGKTALMLGQESGSKNSVSILQNQINVKSHYPDMSWIDFLKFMKL